MTPLDLLVIVAIAGTWLGLSLRVLYRRREPAERPVQATLLDEPVRLPATPGYPDTWTAYPDAIDVRLSGLASTLWPHEEYHDVLDCPTPERTSYRSVAAAHEGEQRPVVTYDCGCGSVHVSPARRRRRRRRGASRTGGRRV